MCLERFNLVPVVVDLCNKQRTGLLPSAHSEQKFRSKALLAGSKCVVRCQLSQNNATQHAYETCRHSKAHLVLLHMRVCVCVCSEECTTHCIGLVSRGQGRVTHANITCTVPWTCATPRLPTWTYLPA